MIDRRLPLSLTSFRTLVRCYFSLLRHLSVRPQRLAWRVTLAMLAMALLLPADRAYATTYSVTADTDSVSGGAAGTGAGALGELRYAILAANLAGGTNTINFTCGSPCTITLNGPLPPIESNLTIDGNSLYRVFFVDTGTVTLSNLIIQNALAQGGAGADGMTSGGGGLGAGAGLFVNKSTAVVTVLNTYFLKCSAIGGSGGDSTLYETDSTFGGGGGGGDGSVESLPNGGAGGFGGGGGGAGNDNNTTECHYYADCHGSTGGAGGPGGGGGGTNYYIFAGGGVGAGGALGTGGLSGGAGSIYGYGGGGAAAGPAIFVNAGSVTISNGGYANATATGGTVVANELEDDGTTPGLLYFYAAAGGADATPIFNHAGTVNGSTTKGAIANVLCPDVPSTGTFFGFGFASPYNAAASVTAGASNAFTVKALDSNGGTYFYFGAVELASTNSTASFTTNPLTLTCGTSADHFSMDTAGSPYTITATDTTDSSLRGTSGSITVVPGALAKVAVSQVSTQEAIGIPFNVTVTAQDTYGNTLTSGTDAADTATIQDTVTGSTLVSGTLSGGVALLSYIETTGVKDTGKITATVSSHSGYSNTFLVTAALAPTVSMAFSSSTITVGGTGVTTLTVQITNPNQAAALSGIALSSSNPSGLIADTIVSNRCGGSLSITDSGAGFSLSRGMLTAEATCTMAVSMHASAAADYTVTTSQVTSNEGGTGLAVSATLTAEASTTTALTMDATAAGSTSTTALASGNSMAAGGKLTLTASVLAGTTPVTAGLVNFCNAAATHCTDINLLGTAQLTSSGTATISFFPGIGSRSYKAVFVATPNAATPHTGSTSAASTVNVTGTYSTSTAIAATGSTGDYTLTATVSGLVNASTVAGPTGSVSFEDTNNSDLVLAMDALGTATSPALSFLNPNATDPATGYEPASVAVGDFNGDGIPDLAVVNRSDNTVTILLGQGDGTFEEATSSNVTTAKGSASPIAMGYKPTFIAVGDLNGDGIPDLAVTNGCGSDFTCKSGTMTVFLGQGDGRFAVTSAQMSSAEENMGIAVSDFNRDGISDLVSANYFDTVTILLSQLTTTATATANGVAVWDASGAAHAVDAAYPGDTSYNSSTSSTASLTGTAAAQMQRAMVGGQSGDNQSTYVGTPFTTPLAVQVTNASGIALAGVSVTFTAPTGTNPGATLSNTSGAVTATTTLTVLTDNTGTATVYATANATTGSYSVTVSVSGVTGVRFGLSNTAMPTYTVTTLVDDATGTAANCTNQTLSGAKLDNACSLRDAIAAVSAVGQSTITPVTAAQMPTINFAATQTTSSGSVTLSATAPGDYSVATNGTLSIAANMNIAGPGGTLLTIDGGGAAQDFNISTGTTASISGLTIGNGFSSNGGGGVSNVGTLTISNSTLTKNSADGAGGGIQNSGALTVTSSTFSGNIANGGGISNSGTLTVSSSTFFGNSGKAGGGIFNDSGTLTATNNTFSGNTASRGSSIYIYAGIVALANNLIPDAIHGNYTDNGGNVTSSANLSTLGNYGGATQTMLPLPGSAAICAGLASNAQTAGISSDQRGVRFSNASTTIGAGDYCPAGSIDAGAVQTDYALSVVWPSLSSSTAGSTLPAIAATVKENGSALTTGAANVVMSLASTDSTKPVLSGTTTQAMATSTTATTTAGQASFGNLSISPASTGDTLTATLTLSTTGAATPISKTASSISFDVNAITTTTTAAQPAGIFTYNTSAAQTLPLSATVTYSNSDVTTAVSTGTVSFTVTDGAQDTICTASTSTIASGAFVSSCSLPAAAAAGTYTIVASYSDSSSVYAPSSNTAGFKIGAAAQSILFSSTIPASVTYGVAPITLSATGGNSGNAVSYSLKSGSPAMLSGSTLTTTGVGTVTVYADQTGNSNYSAADEATWVITVNAAPLTLTPTSVTKTYGADADCLRHAGLAE